MIQHHDSNANDIELEQMKSYLAQPEQERCYQNTPQQMGLGRSNSNQSSSKSEDVHMTDNTGLLKKSAVSNSKYGCYMEKQKIQMSQEISKINENGKFGKDALTQRSQSVIEQIDQQYKNYENQNSMDSQLNKRPQEEFQTKIRKRRNPGFQKWKQCKQIYNLESDESASPTARNSNFYETVQQQNIRSDNRKLLQINYEKNQASQAKLMKKINQLEKQTNEINIKAQQIIENSQIRASNLMEKTARSNQRNIDEEMKKKKKGHLRTNMKYQDRSENIIKKYSESSRIGFDLRSTSTTPLQNHHLNHTGPVVREGNGDLKGDSFDLPQINNPGKKNLEPQSQDFVSSPQKLGAKQQAKVSDYRKNADLMHFIQQSPYGINKQKQKLNLDKINTMEIQEISLEIQSVGNIFHNFDVPELRSKSLLKSTAKPQKIQKIQRKRYNRSPQIIQKHQNTAPIQDTVDLINEMIRLDNIWDSRSIQKPPRTDRKKTRKVQSSLRADAAKLPTQMNLGVSLKKNGSSVRLGQKAKSRQNSVCETYSTEIKLDKIINFNNNLKQQMSEIDKNIRKLKRQEKGKMQNKQVTFQEESFAD